MNEIEWKARCKKIGTYYVPLWKIKGMYAELPVALREYCRLNTAYSKRTDTTNYDLIEDMKDLNKKLGKK